MHRKIISLIKCSNSIHAVGSRRPIQYFAFLDRPGSLCWACVMAYIHVFTWALVPLSIDNFALQLYNLSWILFCRTCYTFFISIFIIYRYILTFIYFNLAIYIRYIKLNYYYFCCWWLLIINICSRKQFVRFRFAMYFIYLF